MTDLEQYWKRLTELPGIVKRPGEAKLGALKDAGARALVEEQTDFQRILLLETPKKEMMLLLDGEIQFYSGDEHRFHESLAVVPFLYSRGSVRRVGVMGGGDGLIARELLQHFGDEIELIRIVDIDPAITELARTHPRLLELNRGSLLDGRVEIVNTDALSYRSEEPFDLILGDLPDPTSSVLGRLYSREFYMHLREQLTPEDGLLAVQIVYLPPLFDGVLSTLRAVFPQVLEYAVWMYSFVRAGFGLAGQRPLERSRDLPPGTRHLTPQALDQMFYFAPDEPRVEVSEVSSDENGLVLEWYTAYLRDYFEERILYY
jgi:spermidine synthase